VRSRTTTFQRSLLVAASIAFVIGAAPASAQTASIAGIVRDLETDRPLDGATVILRDTPLHVMTNAQGRFVIGGLAAGRYTIQVTATGFASDSVTRIVLVEGQRYEVTLTLGRVALRLQEVVVTGSRAMERSEEAVASIAALPSDDILERNVITINQALAFVPGVTFNGTNQMDIRGAAGLSRGIGSRVLMLLDGHPILTGDGGEIDFGTIPLLDLDRVEIVKGAYSAVYGSNALGGVVNLLTTPIESEPRTVLRGHVGTYNYPQQYEWSDGRQGAFGVGLQHSRRMGSVGGRIALGYEGTNGFSENGESSRWLGRVKLSSATRKAPWELYGVVVRERAGEFFVWRSQDEPYLVPPTAAGNYTMAHTALTGGSITPVATATTLVRVSPFVNFHRIRNHFSDNDDWHNAFKPGLLAQLSWYGGGRHAVTIGADGARTWVRSNFLGQPTILDLAAFAQDEIRLTETLKASLGVRVDHHDASSGDAEWKVSPKVGLAVRVGQRATIRASVGAGFRAPSAIEQFVSSRQFGFEVIPNLELHGEQAWSAEIGTTVTLLDRVRLDAAVFGSAYRDLIAPAPAPGRPFVFQFQNVSRAQVAGLDVGISAYVVPDKLELQTTYLLLDTEDRITGRSLPYRSRHNLTGTMTVFQGLAAVDVRYRSRVEEVLVYPLDPRRDVTVVDLRLGYRALNLLWQLRVSNVFNQFYVDVQERNPGAPRTIQVTAVRGL
jgi:outer membrane receptor protein involved in Fe transport